jgi:protein-disulfide isomerase
VINEFAGQVRLVFKDFPLASHERARPAAEAARCAGALGKFWPYHDRLFTNQPRFARDELVQYAIEVGLDRVSFTRCLDDRRFRAAVDADIAEGRAAGVRGTPTFFVNGEKLVGAHPVENFRSVITEALKARPR